MGKGTFLRATKKGRVPSFAQSILKLFVLVMIFEADQGVADVTAHFAKFVGVGHHGFNGAIRRKVKWIRVGSFSSAASTTPIIARPKATELEVRVVCCFWAVFRVSVACTKETVNPVLGR